MWTPPFSKANKILDQTSLLLVITQGAWPLLPFASTNRIVARARSSRSAQVKMFDLSIEFMSKDDAKNFQEYWKWIRKTYEYKIIMASFYYD